MMKISQCECLYWISKYIDIIIIRARMTYTHTYPHYDDYFRFPRVRVHTNLNDAHLYIFKKWVLDLVADKENISSISEDLIPMLVKCQYQKKMVERENVKSCKWSFYLLCGNKKRDTIYI